MDLILDQRKTGKDFKNMAEIKKINQMEPWLDEKEQNAVLEYLKSGGWLTEFKKTREFENMIADYVGAKYCSVVSNGTVSLFVAIVALGIGKGDEVIVPNYTMIASANAVILSGARPILVDIDFNNLCLDLEIVKKSITKKTKAIMLVTVNGRSPNMDEFVSFCKKKKIFLIEDAAQSFGSKYRGRYLGTFGDIGSFSFSMPKIITTGQGGALITNNEKIYKNILEIKDFGRKKAGVDIHKSIGYNFKFTDLQAVIGIEQMKKLQWRLERKKEIFTLYKKNLVTIREIKFLETDLENVSPWFIDILVPQNKRGPLVKFLDENGIGSRIFYPAIHTQVPYKKIKGSFKNSENISRTGLWLPSSSFLRDEEIIYICNRIKDFFSK